MSNEPSLLLKRSEHKKLKKQLRLAERQITTLEKDTIRLHSTTETTVQIARYQTENLDYQLKLTQEEKTILASNLQISLEENSANKTSFQNAITASRQRELSYQAEANDLRNQVTELQNRLENITKAHSEQLTTVSLESQTAKSQAGKMPKPQRFVAKQHYTKLKQATACSNYPHSHPQTSIH